MIASAHVAYDWVFVIHVMTAVAVLVVLVSLRVGALSAATKPDAAAARFPDRPDWAIRIVHILPITGVILTLTGGSGVSFSHAWVQVGAACYLIAAGWIEARVCPDERRLARAITQADGVPAASVTFVRSLDTSLAIIAVAMIAMLVQF